MTTHQVELPREIGSTAIRSLVPVSLVAFEKVLLMLQSIGNRTLVLNITLTTVDNRDIAES